MTAAMPASAADEEIERDFPGPDRRLDDRHPVISRLAGGVLARAARRLGWPCRCADGLDRDRRRRPRPRRAHRRSRGLGFAAQVVQALLEGGIAVWAAREERIGLEERERRQRRAPARRCAVAKALVQAALRWIVGTCGFGGRP